MKANNVYDWDCHTVTDTEDISKQHDLGGGVGGERKIERERERETLQILFYMNLSYDLHKQQTLSRCSCLSLYFTVKRQNICRSERKALLCVSLPN